MFKCSKNKFRLNSIFFFYIFLSQYGNIFSTDSGLFDVRTDLLSVEKLTFDHLKNTRDRQPEKSVCDLHHDNKVTLCWSYLKTEEYNFEFTFNVENDSLNTECTNRKLSMKILDQRQLNHRELTMFKCPQIAEDFLLREAPLFYISDSGLKSVAIIFKQKNSLAAVYPHKYLQEIDFDELSLRTELYVQYKLPLSLKKNQWYEEMEKKQFISMDGTDSKVNLFQRSIDAIKISDPYAKFQAFFRATDVCGLNISQKLFLCREFLTDFDQDKEDLYIDEYSDGRCVKIFAKDFGKKRVSAFQCPPVRVYDKEDESSDSWETMYSTSLHFLTKTVIQARFIAIESIDRTWQVQFQAAGINLEILKEIKQLERISLYPKPSSVNESSMPTYKGKEKSYPFAFQIEANRKMAENSVIELARVKKINSPYEKFRMTFTVQNLCNLRLEEKLQLCEKISKTSTFGYEIAKVTELKCDKKNVFLITTKITTPIRDFTLMGLSCPLTQPWPPFKLHLSGSPETNSALILDQSINENELTARTLFHGLTPNKPKIQKSIKRFLFFWE